MKANYTRLIKNKQKAIALVQLIKAIKANMVIDENNVTYSTIPITWDGVEIMTAILEDINKQNH
jgi:hypothetical protein